VIAAVPGCRAGAVLPAHQDRPCAPRRRRRSRRGAVGRHPARLDLVRGLAGGPASSRSWRRTVWGTKLGVQFSITFLALKALPVLIIGGFTSVPGAIVGGLIVGAGEKLCRGLSRPVHRRRHRILVCLCAGADRADGAAAGPVRRTHHRADLREHALPRKPASQDELLSRHGDLPDPAGSHRALGLADLGVHRRAGARRLPDLAAPRASTCCAPSSFRS